MKHIPSNSLPPSPHLHRQKKQASPKISTIVQSPLFLKGWGRNNAVIEGAA